MSRLLGYLSVLVKWRRLLFFNTLGCTAVALVISLILPYRYQTTARLLPPSEDDMFGLSSALTGGLTLGRLRAGVMGMTTPSDLMVGILESRTVLDNVAERCSIIQYYGIRAYPAENARRQLQRMTSLSSTAEGIVSVAVEAKTPELAAKVANAYVDELDDVLRNSNISRGRNTRRFVERRLAEVRVSLEAAQDSLSHFQQANRVTVVDEEIKAAIDAYAKLRSELHLKEAELRMVKDISSPQNPHAVRLEREIAAFRKQLATIEHGSFAGGFGAGFAVSFADLPPVVAGYFQRYLDYRVQEEAYAMLFEQYEYAKILEARDTPTLTVLDQAVPPERRSSPKRLVLVLIVFSFSLLGGSALALVVDYFGRLQETSPAEHEQWLSLWGEVARTIRSVPGAVLRRPRRE